MRRKFLKFLEREAGRKRQSLSKLQKDRESEADAQELCQASDELEALEELVLETREALIHEHLDLLERETARPPSDPPTHWRSRALRRASPHQRPHQRAEKCVALSPSVHDNTRKSAGSAWSKTISSKGASACALFCIKVSKAVTPVLNPIDRVLGKISTAVHGPTTAQKTGLSESRISHSRRPQHRPQRCTTQRHPASAQPAAHLRKEIARDFWSHVACGACAECVDPRRSAADTNAISGELILQSSFSGGSFADAQSAVSLLRSRMHDQQANTASASCEPLADSGEVHVVEVAAATKEAPKLEATEGFVPISSLQLDRVARHAHEASGDAQNTPPSNSGSCCSAATVA